MQILNMEFDQEIQCKIGFRCLVIFMCTGDFGDIKLLFQSNSILGFLSLLSLSLSLSLLIWLIFSKKELSQGSEILHGLIIQKINTIPTPAKIQNPPSPSTMLYLGGFSKENRIISLIIFCTLFLSQMVKFNVLLHIKIGFT